MVLETKRKLQDTSSITFFRKITAFAVLLLCCLHAFPQPLAKFRMGPIGPDISKQTFTYAVKDSLDLQLDVYSKDVQPGNKRPCVIFVFGGAFVTGQRDDSLFNRYFNSGVEHGYVMISISYRLGLKGVTNLSIFNTTPLRTAVDMATDDLYDATNWIIANREKLGVDTSKIILSGSSSGAITILTAEFERCNFKTSSQKVPSNFKYAGVIAFSGAILSYDGRPTYKQPPAPTLMFHGTADNIVPYNKVRFFNKGLFGSSWIAGAFKKNNYTYYIYREVGLGHEVAALPMVESLPVIFDFLDWCVINKKPYQMDMSFKDPTIKPMITISARALFEKLASNKSSQTTPAVETSTK